MPIAWSSKEARECMDGVRRNIKAWMDAETKLIERGLAPCASAPHKKHDWRRRQSHIKGYGWDECAACRAVRIPGQY